MNDKIKLIEKTREIERLKEIIQTQMIELAGYSKSFGIVLDYNEDLRNELAALQKPTLNKAPQTFSHLKVHHS